MRVRKFITFFLIVMFATPLFGYEEELENTLLILLGSSQETVHEKLGNPDHPAPEYDLDSYNGFSVHYDDNKTVTAILFNNYGEKFKGKIFGFSVGDSIEKCFSLWGEPDKKEINKSGKMEVSWTVKGFIIETAYYDVDTYKKSTITGLSFLVGKKGDYMFIKIKKETEK